MASVSGDCSDSASAVVFLSVGFINQAKSNSNTIQSCEREAKNSENSAANHVCPLCDCPQRLNTRKKKARRPGEKAVALEEAAEKIEWVALFLC
jgi:hypothetical protein